MSSWRLVSLAVVMLIGGLRPAAAQQPKPTPRHDRVTVSAGVATTSGYGIGDRNAELRRNVIGTPASFTLFRAESDLTRGTGLEARMAVKLTRLFAVEVGGTIASPNVAVAISQDSEAGTGAQVAEKISQYTFELSGLVRLPLAKMAARAVPYVIGGAGYLRQLHEDRLLVETGRTAYGGGGVQVWLRGASGPKRPLGVRADARYVRRMGGIDFEDRSRGYGVLSVLGFVGF
jgi:hypothetical protein